MLVVLFYGTYKITINDIMKLIIICKDENKEIDNNNKNLKVVCGLCGGEDTRTTIKIILEEYGDEITEIVSPKCDIIKNLMEWYYDKKNICKMFKKPIYISR